VIASFVVIDKGQSLNMCYPPCCLGFVFYLYS